MKKIIHLILILSSLGVFAQEQKSCEETLLKVTKILKENSPFKNYTNLFKQLKPCADAGNVQAQNYIGGFYLEGLGIEKNEKLGFQYIEKAALAGYAIAQGNLGRLYKYGTGCTISMANAVAWFTKGAYNKNSKAAYSLGYMYYKGLGLDQDYNQAVKWFKLSKDPMAKHWLGVCYYFGYGVSQSTNKAVEYLTLSGTPNSKYFFNHVKAEKKKQEETKVEQELIQTASSEQKIETQAIEHAPEITTTTEFLDNKDLVGEWTGKFIEYDESGTQIQRILPINIAFTQDDFGDIKTTIEFNQQKFSNYVLFEDNNLFVDNFKFTLKKQYTHNLRVPNLNYHVLGMDLNKQTYNNISYLLANLDTYIEDWQETAPPMSIVLRPKTTKAISKDEEEKLVALAQQKEEFIKLYPVPFENQLHITFELEKKETVQVKLTGVNNAQTIVLEPGKILQKGNQTYTANTSYLPSGLYVIKVITDDRVYTRIIIKQ
ncbi:T9SS type A sorting domain-containing protein [Wenyingzhuangia aestuarii]|uniref:T9SS type A sorting domain-containing protein n=1 Tax=Wenyingzhuangia aestuarii TaxID=1647582 RepID=UPI00143BE8F8|nr:T9SS type A sorting domain-containing protein [Wenyingzhuangia aestuarii]NJB82057.1 hypothetical protein [Wenyingzhuangia aestuarii]